MNIWTLLKISSHSDPRSLNCSSWSRFSLIFHLSMVGDGLDAVVHGALLSLVVHAGDDGMAGVCNRDDPFLHLRTLLIIGWQWSWLMIDDELMTHRWEREARLIITSNPNSTNALCLKHNTAVIFHLYYREMGTYNWFEGLNLTYQTNVIKITGNMNWMGCQLICISSTCIPSWISP